MLRHAARTVSFSGQLPALNRTFSGGDGIRTHGLYIANVYVVLS
jgi:hypothetical protein